MFFKKDQVQKLILLLVLVVVFLLVWIGSSLMKKESVNDNFAKKIDCVNLYGKDYETEQSRVSDEGIRSSSNTILYSESLNSCLLFSKFSIFLFEDESIVGDWHLKNLSTGDIILRNLYTNKEDEESVNQLFLEWLTDLGAL